MYKLVIYDDEGKTTIVPLIRDEVSIGRKEGNTIRLTDRNVSRRHAQLNRKGEDTFELTDLGSRNGTKVNGEPVGKEPRLVKPGDQVAIGDYNLSVRTDVSAGIPMGRQMDPGESAGMGKVTPHARLVMLSDPEPGREFDLTVNLYVVGRSEEANMRIEDASISRAHARLDGDEGQWTISDLDSINGIFVNGMRKDDYLLKSGDVIELGTVRLRFVAPGEPYEYQAGDEPPVQKKSGAGRNKLLIGLGALAGAAVIAIALSVWLGGGTDAAGVDGGVEEIPDELSFAELIERGKDKMQTEEWAGAARFFAQALRLRPDAQAVKDLKRTAVAELESQSALVAALAAGESKNWREAVENLERIPRSSYYFDAQQLSAMSKKLCEELLVKARFVARSGDPVEARKVLDEIDDIPEPPGDCSEEATALREKLDRRGGQPGGGGGAASRGRPANLATNPFETNPYDGEDKPDNPYASDEAGSGGGGSQAAGGQVLDREKPPGASGGGSAITWNPLDEARKALERGDTAAAIDILEKGGNGRAVLALLAKLYLRQGNRAGFERTARKFVRLYPDDPRSEGFKKKLGM
ncbi:MAG: FHA domain-containing protein [Polyangia bacterium]